MAPKVSPPERAGVGTTPGKHYAKNARLSEAAKSQQVLGYIMMHGAIATTPTVPPNVFICLTPNADDADVTSIVQPQEKNTFSR